MPASSTAAAAAADDSVFSFFALPRELRDNIYALLTEAKVLRDSDYLSLHCGGPNCGYKVSVQGARISKVLTLNRQFKQEYEEEHNEPPTIIYKDVCADFDPTQYVKTRSPKAEFRLLAVCASKYCSGNQCGLEQDLVDHIDCIDEAIIHTHPSDVTVKIYPCHHFSSNPRAHVHEMESRIEVLQDMDEVQRIEVFEAYQMSDEVVDAGLDEARPYEAAELPSKVWTREQGWLKMSKKNASANLV